MCSRVYICCDNDALNADIGLYGHGTPTNNDIGEAKFDAVVSYSDGSEVLKSFVFDVKEINDAPTLLSDQLVTVDEDSQLTYQIQVADEDSSENLQINIPNGGYVLNENSDRLVFLC